MAEKKRNGRKGKRSAARAAAEKVAAERGDSRMFSRFSSYVDTLYDPEGAGSDLKLAPSEFARAGAPRRVPFDIDYESAADNEVFIAKMYPRLENTIVVNKGRVSSPAASAENSVFFEFEDTIPAQTTASMLGRPFSAFGGTTTPDFELPFEAAPVVTGGVNNVCCAFSVAAAQVLRITLVNRGDYGMRVILYQRDTVLGTFASSATVEVTARSTLTISQTSSANGSNGYAIQVVNASDSTRSLSLKVMYNLSIASAGRVTLTYPNVTSQGYSALTAGQAIDEFRTVAMSLRLTCMGDLTTTGGRAVCALVPREFVPDPADPVGSVAKLPMGAYDGKLIDGCDIIWQPRTAADYSFQPPEWDLGAYYLIVVAKLAKQNTSIRIKGSYNYEIFSLDPSIGGMSYCPSAFGLQEVLAYVFATVPPGSSNEGHLEKAKNAVRVMARLLSKPITWIRENPDQALKLAKTVAKGVAMAAAL